MIFLGPGSHANAARHFLCQAPVNSVGDGKDRLVQPVRLDVGNKSTEFGALN